MVLPLIRYALCPACTGAGCAPCHGTGEVQHGGPPRYRVHQETDGRWYAVTVDGSIHRDSLLCFGCPTREAAAAHAERLGYLPDPRQPAPPLPVPTWDVARPGAEESAQLTMDLQAETITVCRRGSPLPLHDRPSSGA